MDYIIVTSNDSHRHHDYYDSVETKLRRNVENKIKDGYVPQGGITSYFERTELDYSYTNGGITKFEPKVVLVQAMVRIPVEPVDPKPIKKGFQ